MSKAAASSPPPCSPLCPLAVSVPATRTSEGQAPATLYIVLVKFGESNSWTVSKRFAQFDVLHAALEKKTTPLPAMPAKTWFKTFDPAFIEQRRGELEVYLRALVASRVALNARELHEFFEIPENVPGFAQFAPVERVVLKDPKFGVNACAYDHQRGLLVSANEDSFVLSRIDSYISNTRMPWESAPPPLVSVGALNVWARDDNNGWSCVVSQYFNSQATALAWDSSKNHAYVGMDSGMIMVYQVDIDTAQLQLVMEINVHTARVTEIIYDRTLNRLFSTGRDKKLHIHDIGTGAAISTTRCGDAWISSMVFDEATQRVILGSYAQQLMLYDVSQESQSAPRALGVLDGQRGSIRCVCYDAASRYCFSGGFDYSVCMWDIGIVGKESVRSRLVAQFKNGPQAKCKAVAYCPRTRHVLAGYETGMIAVFDSRTAEIITVFEAHAGDIVALHWLEEHRILISGARDCDVKFWLFPEDITRFKQEDALPAIVPLTAEDLDLQREIAELNLAGGAQSAAAASAASASADAAFSSQVATFAPKHDSVTPTSVTRQ